MATKFHAPSPWPEIKAVAKNAKAYIAVPFLGKAAAAMLPVATGSVLVTRFTREAIKAGQVDPRQVIKLIRKGVSVFSQADLHAKVYVFPRRAFIGSANASKTSEGMIEACIETTEQVIVQQARDYVRSLGSDLVTLEYAKSMVNLYPKDGERYFGVPQKTALQRAADQEHFWIVPVYEEDYDDEARRADRAGTISAKAEMSKDKSTRLSRIHSDHAVQYEKGDWILNRQTVGRGFEFECPGRVVHIEPYEGNKGWEAIVYLDHPKRQSSISSTEIRKSHKELVEKLCYSHHRDRKIRSASDVANIKQLWCAFRA
ncbi:MAG: hypothetical protein ACOYBR_01160 [Fluviibacter sp.]